MEEISIPEYLDTPPQVLFLELDDVAPVLMGMIIGAIAKYALQNVLAFIGGIVLGVVLSYFYIRFKRNRLPGTLHHMLYYYTGVMPLNMKFNNGFIQRTDE